GEEDDPDLPGGDTVGPGGPTDLQRAPAARGGAAGNGAGPDAAVVVPGYDPDAEELDGAAAEGPQLHGVHQVTRALRALPATAELRIETLHGRMTGEEKDAVMRRFAAGQVDVLVATTVIEVGVDVPDA